MQIFNFKMKFVYFMALYGLYKELFPVLLILIFLLLLVQLLLPCLSFPLRPVLLLITWKSYGNYFMFVSVSFSLRFFFVYSIVLTTIYQIVNFSLRIHYLVSKLQSIIGAISRSWAFPSHSSPSPSFTSSFSSAYLFTPLPFVHSSPHLDPD